jgi:exonuclease III
VAPNDLKVQEQIQRYLKARLEEIHKKRYQRTIVMGDFNINLNKDKTSQEALNNKKKQIIEVLQRKNLVDGYS